MNHALNNSGVASERLMQLKIDLNSIICDKYKPDATYWKFNKVTCRQLKEGNRRIVFTLQPCQEHDLITIVGWLVDVLGTDSSNREVLQSYELVIYQSNVTPEIPIRSWIDYTDYNIELKGNSEKASIILCIESKNP